MGLQIGVEAEKESEGIWRARIPHHELRSLGRPSASIGELSIIGLVAPAWQQGKLTFSPADAIVLNAGTSQKALLVELVSKVEASETDVTRHSVIKLEGDEGFRAASLGLLSPEMAAVAGELLSRIRKAHSGYLVAGKGRKWVNAPANFVALTIQNRDQSLAVTVRGEPDRHANTPLDLKRDRPGYSRFKVSNERDIEPAMFVIARAARFYGEGRSKAPLARS